MKLIWQLGILLNISLRGLAYCFCAKNVGQLALLVRWRFSLLRWHVFSDPKLQTNCAVSPLWGRPFQRCANHCINNVCFWQQYWHCETKVRLAIPDTEGRLCQTRDTVIVTIIPWVICDPMEELRHIRTCKCTFFIDARGSDQKFWWLNHVK